MAIQLPLPNWRTKIFIFKFFPSKDEEEACKVNNTSWVATQELVEVGPALIFDWNNLWKIKKKITRENLNQGELVISYSETFNHILPYWNLEMARILVNGSVVSVNLWDVTQQNGTNRYEGGSFTFRKLHNDGYCLWCRRLINDRRLGIGDEIGLFWNPRFPGFFFKLISKFRDSIRPL